MSIVISESLVRKYYKTQNPPFRGFIQKTPDDTVWDWIHVYKACLLEEILRGRGAAGEFRELICFTRNEYRDEFYQKLGWMWFGVRMSTLNEVSDEHQTFFAHPARFSEMEATPTIAVDDIDFALGIISEDVTVTHQ